MARTRSRSPAGPAVVLMATALLLGYAPAAEVDPVGMRISLAFTLVDATVPPITGSILPLSPGALQAAALLKGD